MGVLRHAEEGGVVRWGLGRDQLLAAAWGVLIGVVLGCSCLVLLVRRLGCCDFLVYRARGYRQPGIGSDEFFADFDEEGDECPGGLDDEWGVEMGSGGKTVIM